MGHPGLGNLSGNQVQLLIVAVDAAFGYFWLKPDDADSDVVHATPTTTPGRGSMDAMRWKCMLVDVKVVVLRVQSRLQAYYNACLNYIIIYNLYVYARRLSTQASIGNSAPAHMYR